MITQIITVLVGLFVAALVIAAAVGSFRAIRQQSVRASLKHHYRNSEIYVSFVSGTFLVVDFDVGAVITGRGKSQRTYPFSEITSVEIIQNGVTLTQMNRGSQFGTAAVGGLLFGPVGAVVGAMSGSRRAQSYIRNLALRIVVQDERNPVRDVPFFTTVGKKGTDPTDAAVQNQLELAIKFHALITNGIRQAAASQTMDVPTGDRTALLERLWTLHSSGAISKEEYDAEKMRLLRASSSS